MGAPAGRSRKLSTSPAAVRMRRYRERQRRGVIALRVEFDEVDLGEELVALGYLTPLQQDDRKLIERALSRAKIVIAPPD